MDVIDPEKFAAENPNSRFRISNVATLAPGTCILCKSDGGDGRQFIDLGITVEWFGAMYFCTFCIGEAAALIGFVVPDEHVKMLHKNEELILKYGNEKLEVERLQEQLSAARILLRNCHCGDNVTFPVSDVVDVEAIEEPESNDSDSDEYGGSEGPDDISESPADDESDAPKRSSRARKSAE